jgi:DNA-binding HxlR family transcriptional regulator
MAEMSEYPTSRLDQRRSAVTAGVVAPCPTFDVMGTISSKWVPFLLMALAERPHRFGELRRLLPDISQRMLTQSLRDLQRDGYVGRRVLPTNPPSVEYSLTALGQSLHAELRAVFDWAAANHRAVLDARAAFDRAREADLAAG